jgi:hypothetical protein
VTDKNDLIKKVRFQVVKENTTYEHPRFVMHPDTPAKKPICVKVIDSQEEQEFIEAEFLRIEAQVKRVDVYAQALGLRESYNRMLSAFQVFQLKLKAKREEKD